MAKIYIQTCELCGCIETEENEIVANRVWLPNPLIGGICKKCDMSIAKLYRSINEKKNSKQAFFHVTMDDIARVIKVNEIYTGRISEDAEKELTKKLGKIVYSKY